MLNKTLINFRPFFFTAVSIALGIGAGFLFYFEKALLGVLVCLIFLLFCTFVVLFSGGEIRTKLFFSIAFSFLFVFGACAFSVQVNDYANANLEGHYYDVTAKVTNAIDYDYGQKLTLENVSIKGNRNGGLRYGVTLYSYGKSDFTKGDLISFHAQLIDLNEVYEDRLSATNIEHGIKYSATLDASDITKIGSKFTVFEKINLFITNSIKSGMDEKEGAIAIALLLGETEEMDGAILNSYRSAGVAHIFAVSGLHIGFLATALSWIFDKFKINRLAKAIVITLALFFYSGVCGFSASSLRASVMSAVVLFCAIKGNRYDGLSSVSVACTLLLACSPIHIFCVGFQLSFVVVLGIILLSAPIARLLSFLPKKLANSLGTVVSAQVVGIPICLYAFNEFSAIAIIANLIFIPIVGAIFILLFITAIIGGFGIARITLFIPNYLLKAVNFAITAIDYETFLIGGFSFGIFVIFYYCALSLPCGIINLKRITKIIATALCVIVCVVGTTIISVQDLRTPKAFVVGDEKICATVVKSIDENIMIVNSAERAFSLRRLEKLAERENIDQIDLLIFTSNVKDIPTVITRLNSAFELEKVAYYGLTDTDVEDVIRNALSLNVRSFIGNDKIFASTECVYALNGYAVSLTVAGRELAVISEFGNGYSGYKGLTKVYDFMVVTDYAELIYNEYKPKEFICYKNNELFKNASSSGTVTLNLK